MNQTLIQQRLQSLIAQKGQQAIRLREAEDAAKNAREVLCVLDGAIQDCRFWLENGHVDALPVAHEPLANAPVGQDGN